MSLDERPCPRGGGDLCGVDNVALWLSSNPSRYFFYSKETCEAKRQGA